SDLWGPSQVESLGGKRYFLSIVDDYSNGRYWQGKRTAKRWVKFYVTQCQGRIKVINVSRIVLSGTRKDNCLYSLDGHAVACELNASIEEKESLAQVWHKRLGHISEAGLEVLENFVVGRHTTQGVIDYVHSDLWGPSQVESLGGKRRTVKKLRTDNGLEFCNREFKQLCIESGIARHLTVDGTPKQNGSPSTAIEKKTPMEMWSRHPSDYGMLRTFGCVAYSHVQQGSQSPSSCQRYGCKSSVTYKDTLKDSGAGADNSVEELQVEVELQRLNNHTLEEDQTYNEDQTDQDDGDDEDTGDQEIDQPLDFTDYQLVRDREPRTRTKPLRFRDESNMAAFAFAAAEEEDTHEPLTYQEAVSCEDSSKWYKARLVARRFTQRAGIDYNEVFSHTSIRVILALTACKDFKLEQLDVKTAFLHENLEEVIYMRQPPKRSSYDICVYYRSYAPGEYIYILLYVDDMLIAYKSKAEIGSTKSLLKREFDMKDLGETKKILGMEIVKDRSRKILRVSQSGYVSKILNNFRIENGKLVQMPLGGHFKLSLKDCPIRDCDVRRMSKVPYANAVGSLMYLMVCTRPDIAYAATLQYVVALLTTEAEYIALREAVKEAIWLKGLLKELGMELNRVTINCDNQGVIHLSRNHVFHERTKHINVRYHFIKEVLEAKTVQVLKVGTEHNAADTLMNVVPGHKLQHCLELLNVGIG
nr:hypothetical protein [Tanacetum cinerariifolium]